MKRPPRVVGGTLSLGALLAALCVAGCVALGLPGRAPITLADGSRMRLEVLEPKHGPPKGTLLLLHGAGGIVGDGAALRRLGRKLADAGFLVWIPHYFNPTGHLVVLRSQIEPSFEEWKGLLDELVRAASREGHPVGVFGFSLGGFLAIAQARDDPRIEALAELAAGIPEGREHEIVRFPPALLLHGTEDRTVELAYGERLQRRLEQRGLPHHWIVFPGQRHVLDPTQAARADALITAFFLRELAGKTTPAAAHPAAPAAAL